MGCAEGFLFRGQGVGAVGFLGEREVDDAAESATREERGDCACSEVVAVERLGSAEEIADGVVEVGIGGYHVVSIHHGKRPQMHHGNASKHARNGCFRCDTSSAINSKCGAQNPHSSSLNSLGSSGSLFFP